ncbi:NAD(P)H-dependent oxidoreductase [Tsukamurella sp. M9C]|uniref:NADPH-dependent FMN reductase n=1 Tax=unclassified Tsukamurella TaxID=2633480 RepID=UPI001CC951DC|nr:NADPH-dependent FMN reductase [Tsukamurella sp. M9C]MCA0158401.1 NAD(P)H-dependent oxidoreductase [Tsukamurella sp. M9C]
MSDITVLAVVGSLRSSSLNRELAEVAVANAPEGVRVEIAEGIADVPFYNEDIDGEGAPATAAALRDRIAAADALLLLAPPNNGTVSAVLKNVIDWGSRPYGASALSGKRVALAGVGHRLDTTLADAERAVTIAGGEVPEGLVEEFPISGLEGKSVREHDAVAQRAGDLLERLVAPVR